MFDWNQPLVNQDGKKVKIHMPSSYCDDITNVVFDDGTRSSYFTLTGCSNGQTHLSIHYHTSNYLIPESEYMSNIDNMSDEDLAKFYRELDSRAMQLGQALLDRGYTIDLEDGEEVDYFTNITRIYKTIETIKEL